MPGFRDAAAGAASARVGGAGSSPSDGSGPGGRARTQIVVVMALVTALSGGLGPSAVDAQESGSRSARDDSTAALVGKVVSAMTGSPLEGARVVLTSSGLGAFTDSAGDFRIPDAPAGFVDTVEVSLIGFAEQTVPLRLEPGATSRAVFSLSETVLRVSDLEVEVERDPLRYSLSEFERRRKTGNGYFVTPEMIERQDPSYSSDILRRVPGVTVGGRVNGEAEIRFVHSTVNCYPTLYLDGAYWPRHNLDELSPNQILAMEVYRGTSEVPLRFQGPGREDCGVIVVWTRQGGTMDSVPDSGRP